MRSTRFAKVVILQRPPFPLLFRFSAGLKWHSEFQNGTCRHAKYSIWPDLSRITISCRSLTMRYGSFCALDSLNLDVQSGEICTLLGPNGAGKSTTLKLLAGLQKPTSGSATVLGLSPRDARKVVGVMPENLGLFEDLNRRGTPVANVHDNAHTVRGRWRKWNGALLPLASLRMARARREGHRLPDSDPARDLAFITREWPRRRTHCIGRRSICVSEAGDPAIALALPDRRFVRV